MATPWTPAEDNVLRRTFAKGFDPTQCYALGTALQRSRSAVYNRATTLKLTQEGRALYERTAALLAELDETAVGISAGGGAPRGRLRISAPLLFSQMAMGKLAAEFKWLDPADKRAAHNRQGRPLGRVKACLRKYGDDATSGNFHLRRGR